MKPKFSKSTNKNKKYTVITPKEKKIDFGSRKYQHYKDTALGLYSSLNHNNMKRRSSYCARSGKIRNNQGKLTLTDKESANYYARRYLWSC